MLITLITGKVVDVPPSLFFSLSDEDLELELQDLVSRDLGNDCDVWQNSVLYDQGRVVKEVEDNEQVKDLLDLDSIDKLKDLDLPLDIL